MDFEDMFGSSPPSPSDNQMQPWLTTPITDHAIEQILANSCSLFNAELNFAGSLNLDESSQSATVNPVNVNPISSESQVSHPEHVKQQQTAQCRSLESEPIEIKCHPRSEFRPRTEAESTNSSHYIRCEDGIQPAYPTITIPGKWAGQANIIQVTLVDEKDRPHPYTIENKERKKSSLIFKQEGEPNSLCFYITDQDYQKGEKTFLIEHIKSKQDKIITKDLIQTRQLHQSKLRFTRYYEIEGSFQKDEASVAYSCVMTENLGDFSVENVFPLYGPMCGMNKVCVELKGTLPKNFKKHLRIQITNDRMGWSSQIEASMKRGNYLSFDMPEISDAQINLAKVKIIIKYQQEVIYEADYMYTRNLDEDLAKINNSVSDVVFTSSNTSGVLPLTSSTGMGWEGRATKRARQ